VIALVSGNDRADVHEAAAKRGLFACIVDTSPEEYSARSTISQAKRILMARHGVDADRAFGMLRDHSQHNGHKLVDVAEAIVNSHLLLLPPSSPPPKRPA
jgi:dihydropteroate synthase